MTNRRRFIQTLAAIPPALYFRPVWAAPDPSRLALIIGNSSYRDEPLVNPANDAKAVGGLFTQAGFTVDSHLNAKRADMMAAIEKFGAAAKRSETKLVVFYYAGHGAQLDWRNYLLPVDAVVERQEHMKERCVDLSLLLGQFSAAKDKTFVVILDACRNNPFGKAYRPDQKGLSQFDAPVGSLLAYATSPGNVASDGEGANGLYTENLVRELSKRGTRIEDALKRVRLNVRLASKGEQIPWETTSLEGDVFIFSEDQKKLTEAEMENLAEADITEWTRIKSSKKADDWVSYLRTFPNGRFAEIAQMRLTRLLADVEKQRVEQQQQDTAKAEKLAAEKRQQEEQKHLEQERIERERIRVAEAQRLADERKQLEEHQAQEQRRREEEQKAIEARRLQEQERLNKERQRIAEAERAAAEQRKQEEQRQLAAKERAEAERLRLAEAQRIAAERKRFEEQQAAESKRRQEEQQAAESKRRQEQALLDKEHQRIVDAERQAAERRKLDEQRLAAEEQKRREQAKLAAVAKPAPAPAPAAPAVSSAPAPAAKPTLAAAPSGAPMIVIRAGVPVPTLIAPSDNPFSAGRYPLGRIFTVGDQFTTVQTDILTGVEENTRTVRVTRVDYDEDRVEFNHGVAITDLMGNAIKFGPVEYDTPVQFTPAEFQVGKKWTSAFRMIRDGVRSDAYYDLQIVKRETITVPAGSFDTFRIEGLGWNTTLSSQLEVKLWMVPGINFQIKTESIGRNKFGRYIRTERRELVAMRQQAIDIKCAIPTGLKRTLTIKSDCT
jgi:uncharacterized caspase-like protein